MSGTQTISLDKILTLERRPVAVENDKYYAEIGVYSFGRGIFHKQPRTGLEVGDKDLYLVKQGDFIIQITFAWEGAVALASASDAGMYCSVRFPTFRVDENICDPKYLLNYFRTEQGRAQLVKISPGSAGRNRVLSLKRLSEVTVPLPPLAEQRRIVACIEQLARWIEEARGLRRQAVGEVEALLDATSSTTFQNESLKQYRTAIGAANLRLNAESCNPAVGNQEGSFAYVDIASVGRGPAVIRHASKVKNNEAPSRARRVIHKNDVIIASVRPYLRSFALVGEELDNQICSTGFAVFSCGQSIDPQFLLYQFCSPFFVNQCMERVTGGHYPAINDDNLKKVEIIIPPLDEQRRVVAYLDGLQAQVDSLKQLQAQTQAELDALLPSVLDKAFKGEL